jgi:Xaa-Pro aminopeptidase
MAAITVGLQEMPLEVTTRAATLIASYDTLKPAPTRYKTASFVAAGPEIERAWAGDKTDLIAELVGRGATLGLERLNAGVAIGLKELRLRIIDAHRPVEMARSIKSTEEMKCVNASLRATEIAVSKLRATIRPGLTENRLWSVLHQSDHRAERRLLRKRACSV